MQYVPAVTSMNEIGGAPLDPDHTILMFDQIEAEGDVEYEYLLGVYNNQTRLPIYLVASEVNTMREQAGGGSHFMGVFDGEGHANLGDSDDWGDPQKFFPEAARVAIEALNSPTDQE